MERLHLIFINTLLQSMVDAYYSANYHKSRTQPKALKVIFTWDVRSHCVQAVRQDQIKVLTDFHSLFDRQESTSSLTEHP